MGGEITQARQNLKDFIFDNPQIPANVKIILQTSLHLDELLLKLEVLFNGTDKNGKDPLDPYRSVSPEVLNEIKGDREVLKLDKKKSL